MRPRLVVRRAVAMLGAVLVGAAGLGVLSAGGARADEVTPRPSGDAFVLDGHGYGHGRGMSQWGAYGAATLGRGYQEILAGYYPGTTRTTVADSTIRVRVTADPAALRVSSTGSLTAVEPNGTRTALSGSGSGSGQWRLVPDGGGLQLQGLNGSTWTAYPLSGATSVGGAVRLESSTGLVRVWRPDGTSTDYRGSATGVPGGGQVTSVVALPLESYLRGVVPRESPASWPAAALQAQTVAARSYAVAAIRRAAATYDICDTTACQVFGGTTSYSASGTASAQEYASTDSAVTATRGVVLTYQGAIAVTEYSSSNGGWSTAGDHPYLTAHPDPWDGAAPGDRLHTWQSRLPVAALEAAFPAVGSLQRLVVTGRDGNGDWGGRVRTVRLEGSAGSVTTTGAALVALRPYPQYADGVRSSWFVATAGADTAPIGATESAPYAGRTSALVQGWAIDPDTQAPATVTVTLDGAAAGQGVASAARPDVGATHPGYGDNHGFAVPIRIGGGSHQVCASATNIGASGPTSRALGCVPWVMTGPVSPAEVAGGEPFVVSPSGAYYLAMQPDGNLVVYDEQGRPRWDSATFGAGSHLSVQADGNVVVYNALHDPVWATDTYAAGSRLVMQDDGNLVLYAGSGAPLWDSMGYSRHAAIRPPPRATVPALLASGDTVTSPNGAYRLTMDPSGDVVVRDTADRLGWHTGTSVPGSVLRYQTDGNLVVYDPAGAPRWSPHVYAPNGRFVLQDDGNVVLYDPQGFARWDSKGFTGVVGQLL